jgi:hypothetical protein
LRAEHVAKRLTATGMPRGIVLQEEHRWSLYSPRADEKERSMKGNRMDGGTWTRRDVFRVGGMATAAAV